MIEEIREGEESEVPEQNGHMPAAFAATVRKPSDAAIKAYETSGRKCELWDDSMVVAVESNALRAILPRVDGQEKIEAILDPGCQIIAMSEEVCTALALPYDPAVTLNMIAANGGVDQSLGIARNVPFLIGDITLFFQVHILRLPAYDNLLGRPFDTLTQSVVRNFRDENQSVTIQDPNSDKVVTIPTIARRSHRFAEQRVNMRKGRTDF